MSDPDGYYGMAVICSDFDGDGLVDIFVANDSVPNFSTTTTATARSRILALHRARR